MDRGDLAADLKTWLNWHLGVLATAENSALIRALAAAAAEVPEHGVEDSP